MLEKFHSPGGSAYKHRQYPRGHGVKRPPVTDPPGTEDPAKPSRHILAGPALGLIHNDNSVHQASSSMAFSTAAVASFRDIFRLAPAAPLWPPPPKGSVTLAAS